MATKVKLNTSLRNSISAEKKNVENKSFEINKEATTEVKKPQAVTKAPVKRRVTKKAIAVSTKPDLVNTENKNLEINKEATAEVKKPQVVTKAPIKRRVIKRVATVTVKPDLVIKKADLQENKKQASFDNVIPLVDFKDFNPGGMNNFKDITEIAEKFSEVSHKIANLYIENFVNFNDSISKYIHDIMENRNPANFYDINLTLLSNLHARQQELFAKNIQLFNFIQAK